MERVSIYIQNKIKTLHYGKEYSYDVFDGSIQASLIRKNIQRLNGSLIKKTSNGKFYKMLNHKISKQPYEVLDTEEHVSFNPNEYSFNAFWTSGAVISTQSIKSVIRNYLSTMNSIDIGVVIKKFGRGRVRSELISMYKEEYQQGYVNVKGMKIPLHGRWDKNPSYIQINRMVG